MDPYHLPVKCDQLFILIPPRICPAVIRVCEKKLIYSYQDGYSTDYEEYLVEAGEVVVNMGACSALVLCWLKDR